MSTSSTPQPAHFLVIGAQKCGTTTLYEDLRSHPQVWLAPKESSFLLDRGTKSHSSASTYWKHFPETSPVAVTGEVSTAYAMLPKVDVVSRAQEIFEAVKVVYIVRDPIARVISHHHHALAGDRMPPDIDAAVGAYPGLVDYSCYAWQLRPWLAAFGRENVLVLKFEDYVANRQSGYVTLQRFLGLDLHDLEKGDVAHNVADNRWRATGRWRSFRGSWAYQRLVRGLVPSRVRTGLVRKLLPAPPARPPGPTHETIVRLVAALEPQVNELAELLDEQPWWDLRRRYLS